MNVGKLKKLIEEGRESLKEIEKQIKLFENTKMDYGCAMLNDLQIWTPLARHRASKEKVKKHIEFLEALIEGEKNEGNKC